jgi:kinesin family member C2/C3
MLVLQALAAKSAHVPFRDSRLTALLQDSLSGSAKAMMFIHVAPEVGASGNFAVMQWPGTPALCEDGT